MKNTILKFTGAVLMVTAFISCNKDKVDPVVEEILEIPSCKVTSWKSEEFYLGTSTWTDLSTITYNADGYPDKITDDSGWSITFVYSGGKLSKLVESDGVDSYENTYEWNGDKITKYVGSYVFEAVTYTDEYRYEYNVDKVSKIANWDNYSGTVMGEMVEYSYEEFTWTGENVTKTAYFLNDFSGGRVEFIKKKKKRKFLNSGRTEGFVEDGTSVYTYDDKLNPFQFFGYIWGEAGLMGKNNMLSSTYTDGTGTYSYSSTYEYNAENFPTKKTEIDGDYTYVDTYTYDCN
ncbi:MAG: hypothetical protein OEW67_03335 [Cyclobacteriaceae bacterium]|nr:hypothetical protein [Cyclobacteriaceae bacterium]